MRVTVAPRGSSVGDRVAHLPGRAVADVAHRINRLASSSGGDQYVQAGEVAVARHDARRGFDDACGIGQPAGADVATGQPSGFRFDDVHAARGQYFEIVGHRGVLPHLGVHCGGHDDRGAGGEQRGGDEIVGDAVRVLADDLRGGRRDDHEVGVLAEASVRNRLRRVEQRRARGLGRECRERERADEPQRVLSERGRHECAGVDQSTTDLNRLVRGDPTGHAQHHTPAPEGQEHVSGSVHGPGAALRVDRRLLGGSFDFRHDYGDVTVGVDRDQLGHLFDFFLDRNGLDLAGLDLLERDRQRLA